MSPLLKTPIQRRPSRLPAKTNVVKQTRIWQTSLRLTRALCLLAVRPMQKVVCVVQSDCSWTRMWTAPVAAAPEHKVCACIKLCATKCHQFGLFFSFCLSVSHSTTTTTTTATATTMTKKQNNTHTHTHARTHTHTKQKTHSVLRNCTSVLITRTRIILYSKNKQCHSYNVSDISHC